MNHNSLYLLDCRKDFKSTEAFEMKQNYSIWAARMLEHGSFRSLRDQMIWEFHAEGLSRREIAEQIDLGDRWCSRKILQIREYLSMSSASAIYG